MPDAPSLVGRLLGRTRTYDDDNGFGLGSTAWKGGEAPAFRGGIDEEFGIVNTAGEKFGDKETMYKALRRTAEDFYGLEAAEMEYEERWFNRQVRDWSNWDGYELDDMWSYPDEFDLDPEQTSDRRENTLVKYARWPRGRTNPSRRFGHVLGSQTDPEYSRNKVSIRDWDVALHRSNVGSQKRRKKRWDLYENQSEGEANDFPREDKQGLFLGTIVPRSHQFMAFAGQQLKWTSRFYKDGTTYEGLRRNTRLNGLGNLRFGLAPRQKMGKHYVYPAGFQNAKTGDTYAGEFRNNRAWGLGTYTANDDAEVYEGEFYQGRRHGCGRLTKYKPFYDKLKETGDPVAAQKYWNSLLANPATRPMVRELGTWQYDAKISDVRDNPALIAERGFCDEGEVDGTVEEAKSVTIAARMFANKPKGEVVRYTAADHLTQVPVDPEQDPVVYAPGTEWMMPGPLGQLSRMPDNPFFHEKLKQAHKVWTHAWQKWNVEPIAEDIEEANERMTTAQNISEAYVQDDFRLSRKGFPEYEEEKKKRWRRIKDQGLLHRFWPYMPGGKLYDPDGDAEEHLPDIRPEDLVPPEYSEIIGGIPADSLRGKKIQVIDDAYSGDPELEEKTIEDYHPKDFIARDSYYDYKDGWYDQERMEEQKAREKEERDKLAAAAAGGSAAAAAAAAEPPKKKKVVKKVVKKAAKDGSADSAAASSTPAPPPSASAADDDNDDDLVAGVASLSISLGELSARMTWVAPRARMLASRVRGRMQPVTRAVARPAQVARTVAQGWKERLAERF